MGTASFSCIDLVTKCMRNGAATKVRYNSIVASMLVYRKYGDPLEVIRLETTEIARPKENEVLIRMLAAPVNPADINTIQGRYPVKLSPPAVPGIEGIGELLDVGSEVREFRKGDRVVPLDYELGTWRTHLVVPKDKVFKVPKELGTVEAATLTSNPCAAYRMLKDFTTLKPGDTVIQNGANSTAGQNVIQLCKAWDFNSVNVVRDRPNISELKKSLGTLGATHVITEEEVRTTDIFRSGELDRPKLALNCVGGESVSNLVCQLQPGSTMVTYGGMSRKPVSMPISALVFNNIQLRGFWLTKWCTKWTNTAEFQKMFDDLISLMITNKLRGPVHQIVDLDRYQEALQNTSSIKGMIGKKYILNLNIK